MIQLAKNAVIYGSFYPMLSVTWLNRYALQHLYKLKYCGLAKISTIYSNCDWELKWSINVSFLQGLIEEKKLDEFNIPHYNPSPEEVKQVVENEGSFTIDRLDASQVDWNVYENDGAYNITKCIRSVAESLLVNQFGHAVMDKLFQRYLEIIADTISKETTQFFSVIVTVTKSVM